MTYALNYNTIVASCKVVLGTTTMTVYGSKVRSIGSCARVPDAGAHSSSSRGSEGSKRRTRPSGVGHGGPPMAIWGFRTASNGGNPLVVGLDAPGPSHIE